VNPEDQAWQSQEIIDAAATLLRAGPICSDCLGRAFGKLGHGLTNRDRGEALRTVLAMLDVAGKHGTCWICEGLFERVEEWATRTAAAAQGIEFNSYLFGVRLTPRLGQMETVLAERFSSGLSEPLKHAFNREVGKAFEAQLGRGTVNLTHPHLAFIIDLPQDAIELRILPLYIYGRYRKLVRGIPQTFWPCRRCRGRGCETCNFTGKQYPESVEELISAPFLEAARSNQAHLHGAGREDIDARMLGTGRPFVLEVASPKCRGVDLASLERRVNDAAVDKVSISGLQFVSRETVALVKEANANKEYRALVAFESEIQPDTLTEAVANLVGTVQQRTPQRVAHRRADRLRERRLLEAEGTLLSPSQAELRLRSEGGLYIKELVSGDDGRTNPNLTAVIGVPACVLELDVVAVSSDAFPD